MRRGMAGHELKTRDGTARYLPPEVFKERRDERSDIYSLGLTMHELATGRKPWGEIHHETIKDVRLTLRVPLVRSIRNDIPKVLADCIDKASADEPAERYQEAEQLEKAFQHAVSELTPVTTYAEPDSWSQCVGTAVLNEEVWFS